MAETELRAPVDGHRCRPIRSGGTQPWGRDGQWGVIPPLLRWLLQPGRRRTACYFLLIILHVPIGRDRIEDEPEATLEFAEGTQSYTVLRFLAANDEKAFTQTEIHGRTDIPRSSVGVVLSRLENRGLVRHRRRYWAIAEDDRLATLAAQHGASAASTTDDYYGASDG